MIKHIASAIGLAGLIATSSSHAIEAASDYLRITDEEGKIQKTPWVTNTPLGSSNATAERAVIAIHSSGRNAIWYYEGIHDAAELAGELDNTMLYSLQFLQSGDLAENNISQDFELNWWYNNAWKLGYDAAENCIENTATLNEHVNYGRAYTETVIEGQTCWGTFCWGGTEVTKWYASGSEAELGSDGNTTVTVAERPNNWVEAGSCPANIHTDRGYSSFKFVDIVMEEFLDEARFPNLKHVVVAGHSAGGMFVNRYGAGNLIDEQLQERGVEVTYVVAAPSTYMYFDANRPDTAVTAVTEGNGGADGINDFGVTDTFVDASNAGCPGYNNYFYGLDNLNNYMSVAGAEQIKSQYGQRRAVYMVGEYDNDVTSTDGLMKNCEADLEGSHRQERSKNYLNHMKAFYGEEIAELHKQVVIPGVGHNGPNQFKSELGLTYMFPSLDDGIEYDPTIIVGGVDVGETTTTVYGTANDKDGNLEAIVLYFLGGGMSCEGTTDWSCTFNTPDPGDYTVQVKAVDSLGNESPLTDASFTVEEPPACEEFTDTVANHETAGRAYSETTTEGQTCWGTFCYGGTEVTTWYVTGSDEELGQDGTVTVTLSTSGEGFTTGECPADPTPPQLHTGYSFVIQHYGMRLTGTVMDPDYDIDRVEFQIGSATTQCELSDLDEYAVHFGCYTDFEEAGVAVGEEYTYTIAAYDKSGLSDTYKYPYTHIRPENSAPEFNYTPNAITSGSTAEIFISAYDKDQNLAKFLIFTDNETVVECQVTDPTSNNHTCYLDDQTIGEHTAGIQAVDSFGATSDTVSFSYTITEDHIPTIDSWEATVDGTTLTVTGTASDGDGNDDIELIRISAFVEIECEGTATWTCTWPNAGQPGETKSFALHIRDKSGNKKDYWSAVTVTFPEEPSCVTATNTDHATADRAIQQYNILYYAIGSNDYLGMGSDTTSLKETSEGVWTKVSSCE